MARRWPKVAKYVLVVYIAVITTVTLALALREFNGMGR